YYTVDHYTAKNKMLVPLQQRQSLGFRKSSNEYAWKLELSKRDDGWWITEGAYTKTDGTF
ncbi:MAG: hypothetical protein AAF449_22755, partial [Myxococcota bacterium]